VLQFFGMASYIYLGYRVISRVVYFQGQFLPEDVAVFFYSSDICLSPTPYVYLLSINFHLSTCLHALFGIRVRPWLTKVVIADMSSFLCYSFPHTTIFVFYLSQNMCLAIDFLHCYYVVGVLCSFNQIEHIVLAQRL
jgi:hypothetical protein